METAYPAAADRAILNFMKVCACGSVEGPPCRGATAIRVPCGARERLF